MLFDMILCYVLLCYVHDFTINTARICAFKSNYNAFIFYVMLYDMILCYVLLCYVT